MLKAFFIIITVLIGHNATSQTCTNPGQNPSTAFPVCGVSTFTQTTVPLCGGRKIPSPGCTTNLLTDVNPFWYKFTCFQAGTLGFRITPSNLSDDYDWQVFDITGRPANDVYTDPSLVVGSNWSGEGGITGASSAGTTLHVCEGFGKPLFSKMPDIQVGHDYLLLVSHFTNSQSGYSLAFQGGSAVITDSAKPKLKFAEANCGGDILQLKLNKNIKCSSISATGSEFYITPTATIVSSTGFGCATKFDSDSLTIKFSQFLNPGSYTLHVKNGSDGNTLLDYCDNSLSTTDSINFVVFPKTPATIDSVAALQCAPKQIRFLLTQPVLCSTIAANGSDFTITGNYPVTITGATGNCSGSSTTTKEILINLANPLTQAGTFTVSLIKGSDGNTIVNECGQETPVGDNVSFSVKDVVSAAFTYDINYGCLKDTVLFFHPGNSGVNSWRWSLDENMNSIQQNPIGIYSVFNEKTITLKVSNGFCSDSVTQKLILDNYLKADFTVFEDNCPNEPIIFTGTAVGKIIQHSWSFGDGGTANTTTPTHTYSIPTRETIYNVRYTVTDSFGCQNSARKKVSIYNSCLLAVPTAFTPNGDGRNDILRPLNAIKAEQLEYKIYNRWGQLIFKTNDWKQGWDGRYNGVLQATGTFIWMLKYTNRDTKQVVEQKGTAILLR